VHFSSATDNWSTPQDLFDRLDAVYNFEWDVCADPINTKVAGCFFTKEQNGLSFDWHKTASRLWMNPPYGRGIGGWVKKAYEESLKGCTVVCLLPARTDTRWFHDYCTKGKIEFIKGRLKFGGHKNSAPFPSMIVVFG
jgi:site-specific DNA-methyltransferase (adenine-specific)